MKFFYFSSTFSADLSAAALPPSAACCTAVGALSRWRASTPGGAADRGNRAAASTGPSAALLGLLTCGCGTRVWMELRGAAIVRQTRASSAEHLGAGSDRAPAAPLRNARGRSAPAAGARRGSGTAANGTAGRSAATVRTRRRGPRLPKGAGSSSRPATTCREKHSVRFELQLRVLCCETQHER